VRSATRLWVPPKAHDIWRRPWGRCGRWLDLQASEVELILCNSDEKMKRGMASPTPHATAPRRRCPRCGGARQRRLLCVATATPQGRRGGAQRRYPLCVTLQHLCVGSRFSLKQPPGFPGGGMVSAQGFLSTRSLEPTTVARGEVDRRLLPAQGRVSLGAAADRTPPRGAGAQRQHQGRAGERPPFYTLRAHSNEHPARDERSSGQPPTADGDGWQRQCHSHSKPKNLFPCYLSIEQFLCWEKPRKLPR